MPHHSHIAIGRHLLQYGHNGDTTLDEKCQTITEETRIKCVLLAILDRLDRLDDIHHMQCRQSLPAPVVREDPHPVSSGVMLALAASNGDMPITYDPRDNQFEGLSRRAINLMHKRAFRMLSEVTEEEVSMVRGCGALTVREIMEWKARLLKTPSSATGEA